MNVEKYNTLILMDKEDLRLVIREIMEEVLAEIKTNQAETYLTEGEVMDKLGVTHTTLWRWNNTGYLKTVKLGRKSLWKLSDIERLKEGRN